MSSSVRGITKSESMLRFLVFVIAAVVSVLGDPKTDPFLYDKFLGDFVWGTATASYQIEGAWNVSGMSISWHIMYTDDNP